MHLETTRLLRGFAYLLTPLCAGASAAAIRLAPWQRKKQKAPEADRQLRGPNRKGWTPLWLKQRLPPPAYNAASPSTGTTVTRSLTKDTAYTPCPDAAGASTPCLSPCSEAKSPAAARTTPGTRSLLVSISRQRRYPALRLALRLEGRSTSARRPGPHAQASRLWRLCEGDNGGGGVRATLAHLDPPRLRYQLVAHCVPALVGWGAHASFFS